MKKLVFLLGLAFLPFDSYCGQYAAIDGGSDYLYRTNESNSGQKVGYKLGAHYGYDWGNNLRTELEFSYRHGDRKTKYVSKDDTIESKEHRSNHSISLMANCLYDINQLTWYDITPYFGAGVGYCQSTDKSKLQRADATNEEKERDDRFAWQGIAGLRYPLADKMTLAGQYNYFCPGEHSKDHSFALMLMRNF
jgi:opacity protein-like surface antigen